VRPRLGMPSVPSAEASLKLLYLLSMMMWLVQHCGDARPLVHRAVCLRNHRTLSAASLCAYTTRLKHPLNTLDDEATLKTTNTKQVK